MYLVKPTLIFIVLAIGISMPSVAQDYLGELFDDGETQIWFPAPPPPGAIDWNTLIDIHVSEKEVDGFIQYIPSFPAHIKAMDKTTIKLNGYMVPLEAGKRQSHFILQAYPHSCPFHLAGGPAGYVEVKADIPIEQTYEPVLIEGHFQLLTDFSNGIFYQITAARVAEPG
jgi:hypothetical protein